MLPFVCMRSLILLALMVGVAAADATVTVKSATDNSQSTTGHERKRLESHAGPRRHPVTETGRGCDKVASGPWASR